MTPDTRRFYLVRWRAWSWGGRFWAECGHRHRFLERARQCAAGMFIPQHAEVFEVTERRSVTWVPTFRQVEDAT